MIDTVCKISSELSIDGRRIEGELSSGEVVLDTYLEIGSDGRLPNYDGDYVITPKTYQQTLPTKNTSMLDDITIDPIPYSEVSNPSGGNTINIAYIL